MLMRSGVALLVMVVGISVSGCGRSRLRDPFAGRIAAHETIRARTQTELHTAAFYKPRDADETGLAIEMLPLIVQEVAGGRFDRFGALTVDEAGERAVDVDRPTVYADRSYVTVGEGEHEQITYRWFYSAAGEAGSVEARGVRMTLNSGGMPVIWEVLDGADAVREVYVSESLERAAEAEFGDPLPGRSFAVEPSLGSDADLVVARLLSDGPVPMGPWVYVDARSREVVTLLCRCMPSQVGTDFVETIEYGVMPVGDLPESVFAAFVPDSTDESEDRRVGAVIRLRLPAAW